MTGKLERVTRVADGARQWRRNRIVVPTTNRVSHQPTVYFWTPDFDRPAGGIRVMYRHVDVLNQHGISAAVMHRRPGFRCTWFENNTRVVSAKDAAIGPLDLLVVGELDVDLLLGCDERLRYVVLNQSGHMTWNVVPERVSEVYRGSTPPRAMITVSDHAADLLRFAFPDADVRRVRPGLDVAMFAPLGTDPGRRVTFMPRRGSADRELVLHLLANSRALDGWELRPLEGLTHDGVRAELQQSRIFLTLSTQEGFGLPAAEAMACGNFVVGYHGFGGREFLLPEFSAPIETGDVVAVARAIERHIALDESQPGWLRSRGLAAAAYVRKEYSPEHERSDVLAAYPDLLEHS